MLHIAHAHKRCQKWNKGWLFIDRWLIVSIQIQFRISVTKDIFNQNTIIFGFTQGRAHMRPKSKQYTNPLEIHSENE